MRFVLYRANEIKPSPEHKRPTSMMSFLDRVIGRVRDRDQRSAKKAMERLRFVLVTDRSNLSPESLRAMQAEIIEVIKKYCRIDEGAVEMKLEHRDRESFLVADIPLTPDAQTGEESGGKIGFSIQTGSSVSVEASPAEKAEIKESD